MKLTKDDVLPLIRSALAEDLDEWGDITTLATVPEQAEGIARIFAKQSGVVAGLPVAGWVFEEVDNALRFTPYVDDGEMVQSNNAVAEIRGPLRGILIGERTALNFLARLSGIATHTHRFVQEVKGTACKILDTRKTTPGWRRLEKYAVRCGGAENHRMGLYDQVLIKDNHIAACGSIAAAVSRVRDWLSGQGLRVWVEVEARTLDEVHEALEVNVDRILLDNMGIDEMREAVRLCAGRVELEASGNVSLDNVRAVAETGVNFISVGAITHSAPAFDFSLRIAVPM